MAILGKIRSYTGALILVIGLALFAFVFTGVFDGNPNTKQNPIVLIENEEISMDDFSRQVDFAERNYQMSTLEAVNLVYNQITSEKIYLMTTNNLGLNISKYHLENFLQNDPNFSSDSQFLNSDGIFDQQKFTDFIIDLNLNNPTAYEQWKNQEKSIENRIKIEEYRRMVLAGSYVTDFEAKQDYYFKNDLLDFQFVRVPYSLVSDSIIDVKSKDIKNFLAKNKEVYEQEASFDIKYVQFNEDATPNDKLMIENQLRELLNERTIFNEVSKMDEILPSFSNISEESISEFISEYSDLPFDDRFLAQKDLKSNFSETIFNLKKDVIFGPYEQDGFLMLTKLIDRKKQGKAKVRHVLIAYKDSEGASANITRTKSEAKSKANRLLRSIRNGESFANVAVNNSDGPSASNGGQLPEFTYNDMVEPFSKYVFSRRKGSLGIAETPFGFHIIEIQDKYDAVKLATVAKKIIPSEETSNNIFSNAIQFELDVQQKDFEEQAKINSLSVGNVKNIKILDESFPVIGNQRQIVRWLFEDSRKENEIKRFNLNQGGYLIIKISAVNKEGLPDIEKLDNSILNAVIKEKKKEYLLENLSGYESMEKIAEKYDLEVKSANALNRFTHMISGAAKEPSIVGAGFGIQLDKISKPIAGKSGVFVIKTTSKKTAEEIENYAGFKSSLISKMDQNIQSNLDESLKQLFEIEDNRSTYY